MVSCECESILLKSEAGIAVWGKEGAYLYKCTVTSAGTYRVSFAGFAVSSQEHPRALSKELRFAGVTNQHNSKNISVWRVLSDKWSRTHGTIPVTGLCQRCWSLQNTCKSLPRWTGLSRSRHCFQESIEGELVESQMPNFSTRPDCLWFFKAQPT